MSKISTKVYNTNLTSFEPSCTTDTSNLNITRTQIQSIWTCTFGCTDTAATMGLCVTTPGSL